MLAAVRGPVGGDQIPCRLAPDEAASSGGAEAVLLVVDGAEDEIARDAQGKDDAEIHRGGRRRVQAQILALDGVRGRQKAEAAPGEVEAVVVVGDVYGAQVPRLVDEEVDNVDGLQDGEEQQGRCNVADCLALVGHVGEVAVVR